jgi:hypothetical protein
VTDQAAIDAIAPRLTPHPLRTYLDAAEHSTSALPVPGTYLLCSGWNSPFGAFAERAAGWGWIVDRVDGDHEVLLTDPALVVEKLTSEHLVPHTGLEEVIG